MGKNKRNQKPKSSGAAKPAVPVVQPASNEASIAAIEALHIEAQAVLDKEDVAPLSQEPRLPGVDLEHMWVIARDARNGFQRGQERCAAIEARLETRLRSLDERDASLTARIAEVEQRAKLLDQRDAELEARERAQVQRDGDLSGLEADLRSRELNAEVGFAIERRAMLAELEHEREALRESMRELEADIAQRRRDWHEQQRHERDAHRERIEAERRALQAEFDRAHERQLAQLATRERELLERDTQLQQQRHSLDRDRRRHELDIRELAEQREDLDARAENRAAAIREQLEHDIQALRDRLTQAQSDRDQLAELLRAREEADRRFGQRTPDQILAELDALRREREELAITLAQRPSAEASHRLAALEREQSSWLAERGELLRVKTELQRRLDYMHRDVSERETQRDLITSLESQRALLSEAHKQMRAEMQELVSRRETQTAFPACSAMDTDAELQTAPAETSPVGDLAEFVDQLRHRIAHDPEHPERELYYDAADIRSFLGGLAMGRLVLLQGISGTGKTSLPLAFARAVGGFSEVIEVQAGWRDPQDLVGHYNVFEKRFYEREFLKALYRAQTPVGAELVHIVVLDEMNLSHPEQYFSDMLSALERKPGEQLLKLMTHRVEQAPRQFIDGSKLEIASNVWFVGTANHDETTKDFADKTYDRSHVMELPHRPTPFPVKRSRRYPPLSHEALLQAFDKAVERNGDAATRVLEFFNDELRRPLANDFGIGWGPRLERQLSRHVPVVIEAGGSLGEATDHMLATRLLRKLANRHDNRPEQLEALRRRIEDSWLDADSLPERSLDVLTGELRRLGQTEAEVVEA